MFSVINEVNIEQNTHIHPEEYKGELAAVLARPLQPDSIDMYAETALVDLIKLIHNVTSDYQRQIGNVIFENNLSLESAAFEHYGLTEVEGILDRVARKAEDIRLLDDVIANIPTQPHVITPTDAAKRVLGAGGEWIDEKAIIPRLKTILFILENDFNVSLEDTEQITMQQGVMKSEMLRTESYYLLDVHHINRMILVCNEEGNATFVLDTAILAKHSIDAEGVSKLTKIEIGDLINAHPEVGDRFVYTPNKFVHRMVTAFSEPFSSDIKRFEQNKPQIEAETGRYFYEQAPIDIISVDSLSEMLGVERSALIWAEKLLEDQIGEIKKYRFGTRVQRGYSPNQQLLLYENLEQRGRLLEGLQEGYVTTPSMAEILGVDRTTILRAIERLDKVEDILGPPTPYKSGQGGISVSYSQRQFESIKQHLVENHFDAEAAPEGYFSAMGLAEKLGLHKATVYEAINALGDVMGEVKEYRFGSRRVPGYSPEQQEVVYTYLQEKGLFVEILPVGYATTPELAERWKVTAKVIIKGVEDYGEALGGIKKYRSGNRPNIAYSPEQQTILYEFLKSRGSIAEIAPEGYKSRQGIADWLKLGDTARLSIVIDSLEHSLGEVRMYKFGPRSALGYSPDQQEVIRRAMQS